MEHFHSFRSAITWSEPFIQALVTFQIVMFLLSLYVSRRQRGLVPRLFTMAIIAITIRCSEYINGLAAENWSRFATQNYFDKNGVFMSVMVCCPLLLDSFIMLICFLREASQLLIQVKTIQLKKEQCRRQKQATVSENETNSKESGNGSGEASRRGKKYQ